VQSLPGLTPQEPSALEEPTIGEDQTAAEEPAMPEVPAVPEQPPASRQPKKLTLHPPKPENQWEKDKDMAMEVDHSPPAKVSIYVSLFFPFIF
jgi:hypothetical protein